MLTIAPVNVGDCDDSTDETENAGNAEGIPVDADSTSDADSDPSEDHDSSDSDFDTRTSNAGNGNGRITIASEVSLNVFPDCLLTQIQKLTIRACFREIMKVCKVTQRQASRPIGCPHHIIGELPPARHNQYPIPGEYTPFY